jgi:excisionase family DNA binding protein
VRLIDIQTLSTMLSVKPKTIYDWIRKDKIPFYKMNRLVRFNYDEILRWLREKKYKKPRDINCGG